MGHALLTALLWAFAALAFAAAGRRVGALAVNLLRIPAALLLLAALHVWRCGTLVPEHLDGTRASWLALSGVVGLALGDLFYFHALSILGARVGALLLSTWPVLSAAIAAAQLGEVPRPAELAGVLVTLAGVALVLLDRAPQTVSHRASTRHRAVAVLAGLLGACGQAAGMVMSKVGMNAGGGPPVDPLSATLTRMLAALAAIWLLAFLTGRVRAVRSALRAPDALLQLSCGALLGPTLGVWCSLVALTRTSVGVAATLMGTAPVMLLAFAWIRRPASVSGRAVLGTLLALAGTSILFLVA